MESVYRHVTALDENQRRSLEALLGYPLQANQHVYIAVLTDLTDSRNQQRQKALQQLREIGAEVDAHLQKLGVSSDEWATVVDEECEAVRYGKKS